MNNIQNHTYNPQQNHFQFWQYFRESSMSPASAACLAWANQ